MPGTTSLKQVAKDIKELKIQGARKIAKSAVAALVSHAQISKADDKHELYEIMLNAAKELEATRPTEPMMRNALDDALRFTLAWARTHEAKDVSSLKKALLSHQFSFLSQMDDAILKISKYGAAEIPQGANILIHCHSSTTMQILKKAYDEGKNPNVTCLETRPLYQGRLSARELSEYGIATSLCVDSAAGSIINKMDLVLTGADALSAEGDLVNKIGTFTLAQLAKLHSVRFLCAAEIFKYDPLTRFGKAEPIEQRDAKEVWGRGRYRKEEQFLKKYSPLPLPKGIHVLNPAFDRTPAPLISAYITEEGLIPPAQLALIAEKKLKGEINGKI
ncbi:ribose 1,5-bisphosphate isomerase [Candidatus Micrarchaeota archaeon CG10_big_fil_rev_8_21_14_0_10_45_29]|nr:MAG: ribose 1,5-bisphosphate isomerase [Candidatus Micrarchaeota archaeon CG10_big_fil_rev_8_21_14_0_10_45_29]